MLFSAVSLATAVLASTAMAATVPINATISQCSMAMDDKLPGFTPSNFEFSGTVRKYYVAAEEIEWDYAPTGWDNVLGVPMNESFRAQYWGYVPSNTSLGTKYKKAVYRGYTGSNFTDYTEQPDWQGIQGPPLRAEVGDMIEIMFMNKLSGHYANMHSMGMFYLKDSEGSLYYNFSESISPGDAVAPGSCYVYKWLVPDSSAPDPGYESKLWSYHAYISMYQDTDSGLVGPVITYNRGMMEKTMAENREFILLFGDNQESNSFFALENIQALDPSNYEEIANHTMPLTWPGMNFSFWDPQALQYLINPEVSTPLLPNFFPINGYIFANAPTFEMCLYDPVIWYIYDMGFDT
jgi:hypothetical protein